MKGHLCGLNFKLILTDGKDIGLMEHFERVVKMFPARYTVMGMNKALDDSLPGFRKVVASAGSQ